MGLPNELHPLQLAAASSGGYEIEQSLRFDSGQTGTLTRTPSSNGGSVHTTSAWIKASDPTLMANIFAAYPSESAYGTSTTYDILGWYSEGPYSYIGNGPGNESSLYLGAIDYSYKFRDTSAWYHVVWVSTSTQFQIYINGVLVASKSRTQNNSYYNQNKPHRISAYRAPNGSVLGYINCYMAEVHFIDGQALDHEDFGEFDDNGVWRPIEYAGTYGTNGYYLKFDPSATNGIGHDHSGNGNNWTASNFTTSGTGTDVMSDTPTTNWCTLNPLDAASNNGLADGNLKCGTTTAANTTSIRGTQAVSSGKWYFEVQKITTGTINIQCGWAAVSLAHTFDTDDTGVYGKSISGTTVMIAADFDNNAIWTGVDGTWDNSATTAEIEAGTTTNATHTSVANYPLAPMFLDQAGSFSGEANFNFGQRAFTYTPPTGFKALNTSNLPAPTIKDGSKNFNTVTYNGDGGANQSITGVGFQPDWLWIKQRNSTENHRAVDSVRGVGSGTGETKMLVPNEADAEGSNSQIASFDSDGWTFNSADNGINGSGQTYVGWTWKANGSGSSNTDGTITSTVSANPSAGFSIVSYTGNATSGATIGHGLGVAPSMVIVKNRDDGTTHWHVYHEAVGNTKYVLLSIDNVATTASNRWNDTSPSSTVVTLGDHVSVNGSSDNMIAYCFAEVEGYSKISEFTGNGSTDGSFVYCGFKPSWILLRRYAASRNWYLYDAARNTFNVVGNVLYPDLSNAEASADALDIVSNGFKMRTTNTSTNGSGDKILFVAFASNPFGGSSVSPATAR